MKKFLTLSMCILSINVFAGYSCYNNNRNVIVSKVNSRANTGVISYSYKCGDSVCWKTSKATFEIEPDAYTTIFTYKLPNGTMTIYEARADSDPTSGSLNLKVLAL